MALRGSCLQTVQSQNCFNKNCLTLSFIFTAVYIYSKKRKKSAISFIGETKRKVIEIQSRVIYLLLLSFDVGSIKVDIMLFKLTNIQIEMASFKKKKVDILLLLLFFPLKCLYFLKHTFPCMLAHCWIEGHRLCKSLFCSTKTVHLKMNAGLSEVKTTCPVCCRSNVYFAERK